MGRFLDENQTGWPIAEPCGDELSRFLERLTQEEYLRVTAQVREKRALYVGEDHLAQALAILSEDGRRT